MKQIKRRLLAAALAITVCCMGLSACDSSHLEDAPPEGSDSAKTAGFIETGSFDSNDTWAFYWYLCGSDLESGNGAATSDLDEMLAVELPPNVQVVIQTGGAQQWQNDIVDASKTQRYLYSSDGLELVDEQPVANFGDAQTLSDFLGFCAENYPADHTMVSFWNHGGGSVSGAAFDELHNFDSLTLDEMYQAFESVYELSEENPPFELVGFDTCLMATIDVAYTFSDIGRYLVASQELEPSTGWYYSGWLQALADNPAMSGAELGRAICDNYVEGCEQYGVADDITLSVVDLSKMERIMAAYNNLGKEALSLAADDPVFFSEFGRAASRAENYGGNTPDEGYTNMVDLGHLVRNSENILPENAQSVLNALDEAVVYRVNGPYREQSTGLSCYYSYNGDVDDYTGYTQIGASEPFIYLYGYELGGELTDEGMQYVNEMGYETLPEIPNLSNTDTNLEDFPLTVSEDGNAVMELGSDISNLLKGVYFQLYYVDEEEDIILMLGRDNDIDMDWGNGIFQDNFRGVWGAIDGYLCYMEIVYEGDNYNLYSIPILLNGEEYHVRVVYSYTEEAYQILGARKGLDDNGMADKNMVQLKPGDEITTLHYVQTISGEEDDLQQVPIDTFTVTETTSFAEEDMGDGTFMMMFEMVDASSESYFSDLVEFTVEGDTIYTASLS